MMVLQLLMWLKKHLVNELKKPGPHPSWMVPAKIASATRYTSSFPSALKQPMHDVTGGNERVGPRWHQYNFCIQHRA